MPRTDIADLLRRYASQGDEAAFRALVDRYLPLVYSTALRQVGGNATLAEEIAQDVFIALARKCTALDGEPTLAPWLLGATRLAAVNTLRREQRRLEREQKAYVMDQVGAGSGTIDWERTRPLLDSLIAQLAHRDQVVLGLRFFEKNTFPEIGRQLGMGEDAARQLSNRAIDKLGVLLSRRGIQSTSALLAEVLATQHLCAVPAGLAAQAVSGALGAGAVSGATATAPLLISLMKTSPLILGACAVLGLAGLGSAIWEAEQHRAARQEMDTLRHERTALLLELEALRDAAPRIAPPSSPASDAQPRPSSTASLTVTKSSSATGAAGSPQAAVPSSIASLLNQIDHVLAHPELRPLFVAQIVQQLAGDDERFFQAHGISAEQQTAIRHEAASYASRLIDARAKRIGGEDFTDLFNVADEDSFREVKRILGDDAFEELKQYKASGRENRTVDQLATRLYFTDSPLTGEQANLLTQILRQNRFSADAERPSATTTVAGRPVSATEYSAFRNTPSGEPRAALITDAALAKAQNTLPGPTINALRNLQTLQISGIKLSPASTAP